MGASSQRKGREAEHELSELLRARGYDARPGRALNYGTEPDVTGIPGIHIEVKRCERLEVEKWYRQASEDANRMKDGTPAVIFRRSRKPWMILMSLDDFLTKISPSE